MPGQDVHADCILPGHFQDLSADRFGVQWTLDHYNPNNLVLIVTSAHSD